MDEMIQSDLECLNRLGPRGLVLMSVNLLTLDEIVSAGWAIWQEHGQCADGSRWRMHITDAGRTALAAS